MSLHILYSEFLETNALQKSDNHKWKLTLKVICKEALLLQSEIKKCENYFFKTDICQEYRKQSKRHSLNNTTAIN